MELNLIWLQPKCIKLNVLNPKSSTQSLKDLQLLCTVYVKKKKGTCQICTPMTTFKPENEFWNWHFIFLIIYVYHSCQIIKG